MWWRVRQAAWRQAGVQYRWRRIGVKAFPQTGQGDVVSMSSLRMSLRDGGIGWPPFVWGLPGRGTRIRDGDHVAWAGFGVDGVAGVRVTGLGCHEARVAGAACSLVGVRAAGVVAGGWGMARALAVVKVSSWAVRAWILRWIAAGFSVG